MVVKCLSTREDQVSLMVPCLIFLMDDPHERNGLQPVYLEYIHEQLYC